jgi:AhpD family alkylhydroperoxidase
MTSLAYAPRGKHTTEDINMMLDWNEYREQLTAGVKEIGQLSSGTVRGYVELSSAGQKTDLLGAKIRELIALAVAVTARCDGCIAVHSEAAIRRGASREEIAEALGVAVAVNAGAALVYSTRVMDAVREYPPDLRTADSTATPSATTLRYAAG